MSFVILQTLPHRRGTVPDQRSVRTAIKLQAITLPTVNAILGLLAVLSQKKSSTAGTYTSSKTRLQNDFKDHTYMEVYQLSASGELKDGNRIKSLFSG